MTYSELLQLCEDLTNKGSTGISGNTDLKAQFTRYLNNAYYKVVSTILKVDKKFRWDDSNYSNFPIATIDLADNQRDYTLPASTVGGNASTLLRLNRIKIRLTNGDYRDLSLMTPSDTESTSKTLPSSFRLLGNSIRLNCPVDITQVYASGVGALIYEFQRAFDEFTTSDTTQQPGFSSEFHDILAYDASAVYSEGLGDYGRADRYRLRTADRIRELTVSYANRVDLDNQPMRRFSPLTQNNR